MRLLELETPVRLERFSSSSNIFCKLQVQTQWYLSTEHVWLTWGSRSSSHWVIGVLSSTRIPSALDGVPSGGTWNKQATGNRTQVIWFGGKCVYPLSHLISTKFRFLSLHQPQQTVLNTTRTWMTGILCTRIQAFSMLRPVHSWHCFSLQCSISWESLHNQQQKHRLFVPRSAQKSQVHGTSRGRA